MWSLEMCLQDAVDAINRMNRVLPTLQAHTTSTCYPHYFPFFPLPLLSPAPLKPGTWCSLEHIINPGVGILDTGTQLSSPCCPSLCEHCALRLPTLQKTVLFPLPSSFPSFHC